MLAGYRPAEGNGKLEDFSDRSVEIFLPRRIIEFVLQNIHMHVAIAGVAVTDGCDAVLSTNLLDAPDELWEIGPRNNGVFFFLN